MLARRVLKNVIYNSSAVFIGNLSGLVISIYLARVLKPELFGIYSLTISLAFFLLSFTDLGINTTVVRYGAHAAGLKDYELLRGYLRSVSRLKVFLALSVSVALFIASDYLSASVFSKPALATPLKIIAGYVFFFSLGGYLSGIFQSFNDFQGNFVRAVVYELTRIVTIFLLVYLGYSVVGAIFGFLIAAITSFTAVFLLLFRRYGNLVRGKAKKVDWRRVVRFTGYLTIGSITWVVYAYVDSIMIGIFLPAEDVGFYRAAYNIVGAIAGLISIPGVLFPVFVQLEGEDLSKAFGRVFRYSAILAFPVVTGLILLSRQLIFFVYGADYLPAVDVLSILALLVLNSSLGFWGTLFAAKEMPEYPVYVSFGGMIMNVALNYILILKMGIVGAAVATIVSNAVTWLVLAALSKKVMGIFFKWVDLFRPLMAAVIMGAVIHQFSFYSLFDAVLKVLGGFILYLVLVVLIGGFRREDVEFLRKVFSGD